MKMRMAIGCHSKGKLRRLLRAVDGYKGHKIGVRVSGLVFLFWMLTAVSPAQQITASQSQAEYEFGQALHFSLLVQGSQPISEVTLFFKAAESAATTTVDVAVEPGNEIRVEYTVPLSQLHLAPFSTIRYWWQVADTAGNILEVPAQTIEYEDDRFDWREAADGNIVVRWTSDEAALGQTALDIVQDSLPRIRAIIPVDLPEPLRIYIYPSASDLQSSLRLTGREWVGGHANPELGVIMVTAANARTAAVELQERIPHELTHLMLYRATSEAYQNLPRWFNEGLAAFMEPLPDSNEAVILEEAVANGSTISFSQLCTSVPLDGRQAVLAYVQSRSLLDYIQDEYGNIAISEMVSVLADGADCESVTNRVLALSLAQLNRNWLDTLSPQQTAAQFLRSSGIWILLLLAGFVLMVMFLWPINKKN